MPVRKNGYYNDPALGTAFDNLANAFATPSGADVAGFATANATREKAARLSALFANPNDPDFDRKNIAVGNLTGTNSIAAQAQNDATARRNADVSAATTQAVADTNNAGALARLYAAPVILGDGQTANLPAQTVAATGLPAMFRGNVTANQGQTVTTPTGEVIAGAPKPLSDTEVRGAILQGLPQNEQRAVALAPAGVSAVQDKTGEPTNVFTADSVGRVPYTADTRQPQIANYKTPDNKSGTASLDKDTGKWVDTQTKAVLPEGTQTYTASLQGDKSATGLGASTANNIDGQLVDLTLAQDTSKQLRSLITKNPGSQGLVGALRGTVQDAMATGGEVGKLLNVNIDKMKSDIAAGRIDPDIAKKFENFDGSIPAIKLMEMMLTAQVAKVLDPNGRVSNDRYKQVEASFGAGGILSNGPRTLASLDQFDKLAEGRRAILAPVRPDAAKIGQAPVAASAVTGAAPAIRTYNPATGALE